MQQCKYKEFFNKKDRKTFTINVMLKLKKKFILQQNITRITLISFYAVARELYMESDAVLILINKNINYLTCSRIIVLLKFLNLLS